MAQITEIFLLCGLFALITGCLTYRSKRRISIITAVGLWLIAALCGLGGGYSYWFHHRRPPEEISEQVLFTGITYSREVFTVPRPNVVHIVKIDLEAPGIGVTVTSGELQSELPFRAETTSQFLADSGVQVAISAGFFHPFYARGPLWYYPHAGDPVDVYGLAMFEGQTYSDPEEGYQSFYVAQKRTLGN